MEVTVKKVEITLPEVDMALLKELAIIKANSNKIQGILFIDRILKRVSFPIH